MMVIKSQNATAIFKNFFAEEFGFISAIDRESGMRSLSSEYKVSESVLHDYIG